MPFRRLPDTDPGRLQALEGAAAKAAVVPAENLAFTAATKTRLDLSLPQFRTEMQQRGSARGVQVQATEALDTQKNRLRTWISHFFQGFNNGVVRSVFQAAERAHFQLAASQDTLPKLSSEADLLMWSQRIVDGDAARVTAGGAAMPFPSASEVGTERATYVTLQADQTAKKDAHDDEQEDVEVLRVGVDELIEDIWDEVEFHFRKEAPSSVRANAREYGVVYVTRPGETPEPGEPPAAPQNVALEVGQQNSVTASWSPVAGANHYIGFKQLVGEDPDFVQLGTTTETTMFVASPSSGQTVRFKVRAVSGTGQQQVEGPDSEVVEVTLP